jgi:hypothetical protein
MEPNNALINRSAQQMTFANLQTAHLLQLEVKELALSLQSTVMMAILALSTIDVPLLSTKMEIQYQNASMTLISVLHQPILVKIACV